MRWYQVAFCILPLAAGIPNSPVCSSATVEVWFQPIVFSSRVSTNTVIDPFKDGDSITITNVPTLLVNESNLTVTFGETTG
jgi:hypothetical protein